MKSDYLRNKIGRILLALSFLVSVGVVSSTAVQAQWRDRDNRRDQNRDSRRNRDEDYRRNRDRDYRQNRDYRRNDQYGRNGGYGNGGYGNGGYGNGSQVAVNQGYQDGLYTGSNDAQRGQSYNPQRSHFYQNGHSDNSRYGNSGYNAQAYRQGFLRGYQEGYRRNNRRGNGRSNNRWPFPF